MKFENIKKTTVLKTEFDIAKEFLEALQGQPLSTFRLFNEYISRVMKME
jgi:hypothetical protein